MDNQLRAPVGTRVRALITVHDLPGNPDPRPIHSEPGELGTVVHVDDGMDGVSTVTFDRTWTSTCVTRDEVEVIGGCPPAGVGS